MGPLQTPEPAESISSPLSASTLDGTGSVAGGGARKFFMSNAGKARNEYYDNVRAHGEGASYIGGDKKEEKGYGSAAIKGLEPVDEMHGSRAEGDHMRKKLAALGYGELLDQRRPETMRRSFDSGYGGGQLRRGRNNSFGYGEEAKRANRHSFGYGEEDKRASLVFEQSSTGYGNNGEERRASLMHGYGDESKGGGERGSVGQLVQVKYGVRGKGGGGLDLFNEGERGRCVHLGHYKQGEEREERHGEGEEKRENVGEEEKRENVMEGVGNLAREEKRESGEKVGKGKKIEEEEGGEVDYVHRGQWLRAAILGANDGLVSTASLMMGVGAVKDDDAKAMVISGLAGLVGGACSMAIGEFISVYSQRDAERFDKKKKTLELAMEKPPTAKKDPNTKDIEQGNPAVGKFLQTNGSSKASIAKKGFTQASFKEGRTKRFSHCLKLNVGRAMKQGAKVVGDHKLEMEEVAESTIGPSPWEAAGASGLAFAIGAMMPLLSAGFIQDHTTRITVMMGVCSGALICMGAIGAKLSAGSVIRGSIRVLFGGWAAMLVTYGLLRLFGASKV